MEQFKKPALPQQVKQTYNTKPENNKKRKREKGTANTESITGRGGETCPKTSDSKKRKLLKPRREDIERELSGKKATNAEQQSNNGSNVAQSQHVKTLLKHFLDNFDSSQCVPTETHITDYDRDANAGNDYYSIPLIKNTHKKTRGTQDATQNQYLMSWKIKKKNPNQPSYSEKQHQKQQQRRKRRGSGGPNHQLTQHQLHHRHQLPPHQTLGGLGVEEDEINAQGAPPGGSYCPPPLEPSVLPGSKNFGFPIVATPKTYTHETASKLFIFVELHGTRKRDVNLHFGHGFLKVVARRDSQANVQGEGTDNKGTHFFLLQQITVFFCYNSTNKQQHK